MDALAGPEASVAPKLISDVRAASRKLVREFGLLNKTIAGTDLPLSAVHAITEIGLAKTLSAKQLGALLGLEKSTVSRLLRVLIDRGEVEERVSAEDGRRKDITLTAQGWSTARRIDTFAETQVRQALQRLDRGQRTTVKLGLADYAAALSDDPSYSGPGQQVPSLSAGYRPGILAQVLGLQTAYYAGHHDFGASFETEVGEGLADFGTRLDHPKNQMWHLSDQAGQCLGSITIDGQSLGQEFGPGVAQLRWFIVDPAAQGLGIGRKLMDTALGFAQKEGFGEVHLWTFSDLKAAKKVYASAGFKVVQDYETNRFGPTVLMQRYVLEF